MDTLQKHDIHSRSMTAPEKLRLDIFLVQEFPHFSRTYLRRLIDKGQVKINDVLSTKPSTLLVLNDVVEITFLPTIPLDPMTLKDRDFGVELIFKHEHFLIINKPAGLLVHKPNTKSVEPTLVDWLKINIPTFEGLTNNSDRPGIIHRLDKNTSGLMVIALTNYAHMKFGEMFRKRTIKKTYHALVMGHPSPVGIIDTPIGRHQTLKHKMTTYSSMQGTRQKIRDALTHYKVITYFDTYSLVEAKPVTGRTHQIRVHLDSIGHPIIADTSYNTKQNFLFPSIQRQALHAFQLDFVFDGQEYSFVQSPPKDFTALLTPK